MGKWGVGMPASLLLDDFGLLISDAFGGEVAYQVGSSMQTTDWRDVDVRLILSDEQYEAMGFGDPKHPQLNRKWVALVRAFSALGREVTGLPIDFQIDQQTRANEEHKGQRNALIKAELRRNEDNAASRSEPHEHGDK